MLKRVLAFFLCTVMIFSAFSAVIEAQAADSTMKTLISLTKKFPHKKYWNHVGSKKNNPDNVTSRPCPTHKNIDWNSENITCNSFENAIQCMGFAYKIGYEIVGTSPRSWDKSEKLSAKNLRVGDIIRYRNGSHSLVVTGVKGNEISFVDANWYPGCQIRWGKMKLEDMPGFSYVLHQKGNGRKNTNLDFHKNAVDLADEEEQQQLLKTESWQMNDEGYLNVRAGASVGKTVVGQIPPEATFTVSEKKNTKDHLWGFVTYGSLTGWAALDYSTYLSGQGNAPVVAEPKGVFAAGETIPVSWEKTGGANCYTMSVLSSSGKKLASIKTGSASATFTVDRPDKVKVYVTASNSHAPSWKPKSKAVTFNVLDKADILLTSITPDKSSAVIVKGKNEKLSFSVAPDNAGNKKLLFKSADSSIAEVDESGVIKAKNFGRTTVTASSLDSSGLSAGCSVTVVPAASEKLFQTPEKTKKTLLTVQWKKVSGAVGYRLYSYNKTKKNYRLIGETEKTSFTVTGLKPGTSVGYSVRSFVIADGKYLFGAFTPAVLLSTKPEAPVVTATIKNKKAVFKWKKVSGATGYEVYIKKNGKYVLLKKLSSAKTTFEKQLAAKEKCLLRVKAVAKSETATLYSAFSKTVSLRG